MGILRLLLAITVVIAHSTPIFNLNLLGGQLAVQTFYIISGFYMALILNEKYVGSNGSYKLFISNRLLRLYPIYWVVLLLTIGFSIFTYFYSDHTNWGRLTNYFTHAHTLSLGTWLFLILTNIFLIFQDLVMFLGLDTVTGNLFFTSNIALSQPRLHHFLFVPQAWTIGIEILFYLIAPFIVRKKIILILLLAFSALALRIIIYKAGYNFDPWTYRFFPTELLFFLLGILNYRIIHLNNKIKMGESILYIVWFLTIIFTVFYNYLPIPVKLPIYILFITAAIPLVFSLSKNWKIDRYLGELSYPIYISHIFILSVINLFEIPIIYSKGLVLSVASILFSILLHELVSKKIEHYRQKRVKR